jgi:hypothetical protein
LAAGRIDILRFYRVDESLKIREEDFSDKLFKVRMTVDGRSQTAHVTFYKGHIFSVEFKNPSLLCWQESRGSVGCGWRAEAQLYARN